ncbi:MAG: hypothetical protein A1D16_12730 [Flavihumibacter sp. CACIAM 22H1]|nr:hypothetical protein [Flavihumibacter sp. CACIAM 22H1]KYP13486.1 MAG: hypothetical protein A1D16_12730 [Flavihumibacter sp. CACIAM 22H1]
MSLVILALIGRPCADLHTPTNLKAISIHAGTENHQEEKGTHADSCSPLCVCACCSIVCINTASLQLELPKISFSIEHMAYYLGAPLKIATPIWQPPN